jgi:phage terminase large subunit-like protein
MALTYKYHRRRAEDAQRNALRDLSPEDQRAADDFPYFCEWVSRNAAEQLKQPEHMQLWNELILTGKNSSSLMDIAGDNLDLLSPRGSAKSTYLGMLIAWLIGRHTNAGIHLPILYISYNIEIARAKSATIRAIIESTEYQEVFPKVRPGRKWADEYWNIDYDFAGLSLLGREPFTMVCAGLKGGITSKRSALVVFDDIIKSAEDIANPDIREELITSWRTVIKPTMFEGARAICLGTRFRADDIHSTTFCPDGGWVQIEQQALLTDPVTKREHSYWEDMWSTEYLLDLRDGPDGDPVAFSFQYQNKVMRVTTVSIDPKWIKKADPLWDLSQYDSLAVGLDLSSKKKQKNDFTVATLGGRIGNKYYILDMVRGRWMGNLDKIDGILEMLAEWEIINSYEMDDGSIMYQSKGIPVRIYGEDVQYQASMAGDWRTIVVDQYQLYDLQYVLSSTHGQDLMTHLRSVTGLFQNGLITFNVCGSFKQMIKELVEFGATSHDDCVASIVHLLRGLRKYARVESM